MNSFFLVFVGAIFSRCHVDSFVRFTTEIWPRRDSNPSLIARGLNVMLNPVVLTTITTCETITHAKRLHMRNDYMRNDYMRNDYMRNDYMRNDYMRNDYMRNDYMRNDYYMRSTSADFLCPSSARPPHNSRTTLTLNLRIKTGVQISGGCVLVICV